MSYLLFHLLGTESDQSRQTTGKHSCVCNKDLNKWVNHNSQCFSMKIYLSNFFINVHQSLSCLFWGTVLWILFWIQQHLCFFLIHFWFCSGIHLPLWRETPITRNLTWLVLMKEYIPHPPTPIWLGYNANESISNLVGYGWFQYGHAI